MATLTLGVLTTSTTNAAATYASGSFTPVANDLLVCFVITSGNSTPGTLSDSQNLGWLLLGSQAFNSNGDILCGYVANKPAAASSMTVTYTPAVANATGCAIQVTRVASHGGYARQAGMNSGALSVAPSIAMGVVINTNNASLVCVGNTTNPPSLVVPSGWSNISNSGYSTPTTGISVSGRASGETNTTITFGAVSLTAWGAMVIEIYDSTQGPTPAASWSGCLFGAIDSV